MTSSPTRGLVGMVALGLRRLRRDFSVVVVLAVVVAATAFGVAALPRFVSTTSDEALANAADSAPSQRRNMTFGRIGRIFPAPDDPFGAVEGEGEILASEVGDTLASTFSGSNYTITSATMELRPLPTEPQPPLDRWFWFRRQSDIDSEVTLVAGSLPQAAEPVEILAQPCDEAEIEEGTECELVELPVFQTAVTQETADALRVTIGDRVHLSPDSTSGLNSRLPLSQIDYELILEISGIVELSDPTAGIWDGDPRLHEPIVIPAPLGGFLIYGMGLLAEEDYARLLTATAPSRFSYEWRYFIDVDRIDSQNIGAIGDEVEELALLYESRPGLESPTFFTGVDDLATEFVEQRELAVSFSSLVLVGLLGVIVAVTVVLASLAARRREGATVLVRSRGADTPRMAMARMAEGFIVFAPAAAVGLAVAFLVPGRDATDPLLMALGVAVGLALVFMVAAMPSIAGDLGTLVTGRPSRIAMARRVVLEGLIVGLAVAGAVLIRQRGIDPGASGFDPLLAAVPLLIGLAMGVVALRLAPQFARLAASIGSRGRGVVGMIGFRELAGRPLAARLPSMVIVLGVTIGVFGLIQIDSVERAQVVGSWQTVGANYRIEPTLQGSVLSPELMLDAERHEISATADATIIDGQVDDEGALRGNLQVLGVDLSDYQAVGEGTPADPAFPPEMLEAEGSAGPTPIPAIISTSWPIDRPPIGAVTEVVVGRIDVEIVVTGVRSEFPGLALDRPFVVVDRESLGSASDQIDVNPTRRYVRAPDSASTDLTDDVASQMRGARVVSRPDLLESIAETPTMGAIVLINSIALGLVALLAVVAAVSGFALTSRERTRDLGYMRAIGLTRRQMVWAVVTEQLPPALLSVVLGVGAGIVTAILVEPAIDTTSLTGTMLTPEIVVDWGPIIVVSLGVLVSVLAATAIYSYAQRELDLAEVLRRSDRV